MARSRRRQREEPAKATTTHQDIDFPHLWRQLRAAGWKAKRPTGLQTEYSYTTPDGANIFVGNNAVVEYAFQSGLLREDNSGAESDDQSGANDTGTSSDHEHFGDDNRGADAVIGEDECTSNDLESGGGGGEGMRAGPGNVDSGGSDDGNIRPSQIDTSVLLSQRTLNSLFDSPSQSEVELSLAAVPRAFDLSPSDLRIDDSQRDAAAGLQLLSEASGLESGSESDSDGGTAPAPTTPVRRLSSALREVKRDVNYLQVDENPSDYESLSSSESDGIDEGSDPEHCELDEDNDVLSDSDAVEMDEAFMASLQVGNSALGGAALKEREAALRGMKWSQASSQYETNATPYPGLNTEQARPVRELLDLCHSPIMTFFYFMPKSLWVMINSETNRYSLQQVKKRAEAIYARQSERRHETVKQIARRLKAKPAYETQEILHVVGLLVARMLCPQKRRFAAHWAMTEDGAVPAGLFGRFMARNRCQDIMRDLHFVDNTSEHTRDKLWKLRPVADKIQQRFLNGWTLPSVFSFDEGVLPATSRRNTTRMFLPDKPHRYGTKMFMVCDSNTAYCHRFEVYVGKRYSPEGNEACVDYKAGAASVLRNLKIVFDGSARHTWHAVVVDRFYSSVLLAVELLKMNVYIVGTIMTNRLGFDKSIKAKQKTRPASIPRGTFSFSRSLAIPSLVSYIWWDRKPVYYMSTGSVMAASTIERKVRKVGSTQVPCPSAVNDYQNWMGGVDRHDQLRLQSYSLQMSTRFKKYYKSLFLGFIDMVMVNAYLSHKEAAKIKGTEPMKRAEWFTVLQNQLLQLKPEDFAGVEATPPPASQKRKRASVRLTHALEQSNDWITINNAQKRRQRSCKVCALLRTESKKSFSTTYFCERCSVDDAKCWLCNKIRREYKGVAKTCFDIWHDDFDAGQSIPPTLGKRVVLRRPGQNPGKRKRTRRELQLLARKDDNRDENWNDEEGSSEDEA